MFSAKQIAVIALIAVLVAALFSLNIKGLQKEEASKPTPAAKEQAEVALSLEQVSESAKQTINASLAAEITSLETALKNADEPSKLALYKQLAQKWDDVNVATPSAFYKELVAQTESSYENWVKAGDQLTTAYQTTQDSTSQPALVQKAITAYQAALKLNPASLDAKTGLGTAYVSGTPNPMQGITLLLEVVKEDPKNVKANTNLGLFSMRSGQFDKAVTRFKTVIEQKPDPEAWFYLATCYENLGQNKDAILAYEKSKELAADPGLSNFVDQKIQALKK
ncbi:MAG: tetratricopeptide repeat protein [Sphingobacteriaceae bacterium]|nr:tetratricopeptide repeat protein [Sphingobacteriaceae bacterium]